MPENINSPLVIRTWCWRYAEQYDEKTSFRVGEGMRGTITGAINSAVAIRDKGKLQQAVTDYNRWYIYGFLFTPLDKPFDAMRSAQLSDGQWYALQRWVNPSKVEDAGWISRPGFIMECQWILNIAKLVASWTDYHALHNPVHRNIGSFFPAIAERLQEKLPEVDTNATAPVATAISMGGVPVAQPANTVDYPLSENEFQQQKLLEWLKEHGKEIGARAGSDELCKRIITTYKLIYSAPGDPGAWGVLTASVEEYKTRDKAAWAIRNM